MITPKEKYVFIYPKNEDGTDMLYRFMMVLNKPLGHAFNGDKKDTVGSRLIIALGELDGVDGFDVRVGRYSVEVAIARTFDPVEVIEEIKRLLVEDVLSELVIATPQQAAKLKLVKE